MDSPSIGTDSPASPPASSRKKKTHSTSSRGVASLNPEQLAKKRANDREAQRAIRERTKTQIESLELRIRELTAQQPYQELQAIIRQKEAIQAENDELRQRLASVLSIIQPVIGAQSLTDLAAGAQGHVHLDLPQENGLATDPYLQRRPHDGHAYPDRLENLLTPSPANPTSYPSQYARHEDSERMWQAPVDALSRQRDFLQHGLELGDSGERLSFNFLLDGKARLQPTQNHRDRSSHPHHSQNHFSTYVDHAEAPWAALPKNVPPTCALDGVLLNFLEAHQREIKSGARPPQPSELSYPSVSSLLNPTKSHFPNANHTPPDPLSQVMTDIISNFPGIAALPEQVATLYLMFLLMRWHIYPTQENYERLPDWLTPRPSQLFTPHPAWIDYVPWPRMRNKVVQCWQDYPFENWFIPFTTQMSVNWPYEDSDCLLNTGEDDQSSSVVNPVFERHLMRLENWSLGPAFLAAFPALRGTARIKGEEGVGMGGWRGGD